jgi:hypothetical protein
MTSDLAVFQMMLHQKQEVLQDCPLLKQVVVQVTALPFTQ